MAKIIAGDLPSSIQSMIMQVSSRAATDDLQNLVLVAPYDITIKAAKVTFASAVTGAATNYFTVRVRNLGTNGSGTTDLASLAFSSTSVTASAKVPKALTLASTATASAGELIAVMIDHAGNGLASPCCTVQFDYTWT